MTTWNYRILFNWVICLAAGIIPATGQSSFQALTVPLTAQQVGLTGGSSTVSSVTPRSNPAVMEAEDTWICLNYTGFPADISGHHLQLVSPYRNGVAAVAVSSINYGSFEDSYTLETFTARDLILRAAWKSTWQKTFSYGAEVGWIHSRIEDYSASAMWVNLGLRGRLLDRRLGLAVSLENAGMVLSDYDEGSESLPMAVRGGISYQPQYMPAVIAVDAVQYTDEDIQVIASVELRTSDKFLLRVSTSSYKEDLQIGNYNEKFISGLAGGLAINFNRFTLDVGIQDLGPAGIVSSFGLNYRLKKTGS